MSLVGQSTVLIVAVDKERREMVRWLIEDKGVNVNQRSSNFETALQRAIYRHNEHIVQDLLKNGADPEHRMTGLDFTMPLFAITRDQPRILDMLLEAGASTDYIVNGKPVDEKIKRGSIEIDSVHIKHERWRQLRQWLKLEEEVGKNIACDSE